MKQLNDYKWLCNRYKVQDYILNDRSWEEISKRHLLNGLIVQLIGTKLLSTKEVNNYE